MTTVVETLAETAARLRRDGMRCNCDLDNWQPESDTGHSWVCRIHVAAKAAHHPRREIHIPHAGWKA